MRLSLRRGALAAMLMVIGSGLTLTSPRQEPTLAISHRARALHPGELVVLTIQSSGPLATVDVRAFDRVAHVRAVPDQPHTWQAVIGVDLDVRPGRHEVAVSSTSASGPATAMYALDIATKAFPTRRLNVDPDFVNPPAIAATRIAAEAAELARAWKGTEVLLAPGPLTFVAPVPHRANSAFGTRSIFNGEPRSAHGGADFLSPAGTPVKAPAPGRVVLSKDLYYTGGTVVIDHGLGIVSLFAHLSATAAHAGDDVRAGSVVGRVGATGRVTGAHLHWTVRVNGARVDPLSLLALLGPV